MAQLPGSVLNEFLNVSHNKDGTPRGGIMDDLVHGPSGIVDIRKFGAKIDGATDDSAAINTAINALPRNGGVVVIPYGETGKCVIKDTILINKVGVRILGIGSARIFTNSRLVWHGKDAQTSTGSINAGATNLTSNVPTFTQQDVGKTITIHGAGRLGRNLCSTIVSVLNSTQCTLANAASTSVNGAEYWYATGGGTMMKVKNGSHGISVENLVFDANCLADHCLHIEARAGSSTHDPYLSRLHFEDYQSYALILGEKESNIIRNGQLRVVTANHLVFCGGPGRPTGILVNAQNAEFVNFFGLYFDPLIGSEHAYHIRQVGGGIQIFGMASTRALEYAIITRQQLGIYGWRSEDRFMVKQESAGSSPSVFVNIQQRNIGNNDPKDIVFELNNIGNPQTLQSVQIQGSILVGPTNNRYINAQGIKFDLPGAGYQFGGPIRNQRGIFHDSETGSWALHGTSPSINFRLSQNQLNGPVTPGGALTGVRGISSLETESNNLCGLKQIKSANAFADVTFDIKEKDEMYHVVATANAISGNVPLEARTIHISNKCTTGFRLNLAAAPGAGSQVDIAWILIR